MRLYATPYRRGARCADVSRQTMADATPCEAWAGLRAQDMVEMAGIEPTAPPPPVAVAAFFARRPPGTQPLDPVGLVRFVRLKRRIDICFAL